MEASSKVAAILINCSGHTYWHYTQYMPLKRLKAFRPCRWPDLLYLWSGSKRQLSYPNSRFLKVLTNLAMWSQVSQMNLRSLWRSNRREESRQIRELYPGSMYAPHIVQKRKSVSSSAHIRLRWCNFRISACGYLFVTAGAKPYGFFRWNLACVCAPHMASSKAVAPTRPFRPIILKARKPSSDADQILFLRDPKGDVTRNRCR